MPWTAHQRRMLAELGLPPWLAPAAPASAPGAGVASDEVHADAPGEVGSASSEAPRSAAPAMAARVASPSPRPAPPEAAVAVRAVDSPVVGPASAARPAVDALDWDRLRAAVQACTACGLCQGRSHAVFGAAEGRADWMIVGDAPDEHEDRLGEPVVGTAGQLLDNMLRALALRRLAGDRDDAGDPAQRAYVTDPVKCRPPANRNPSPEELAACQTFLQRQIALVQPKVILAMGRFAVQSLLNSSEPIGRLRGRVHRYQGLPVIVSYHPAYLLRHAADKARAWDDLCLAAETVEAAAAGPA